MTKKMNIILIALGVIIPIIIIIVFALSDISLIWSSWGKQEDGTFIKPDGLSYILLVVFKFVLYFLPSLIISIPLVFNNKDKINKKKYLYYFLKVSSVWFLIMLSTKLIAESIFEIDRIFGITLLNSIKDIQTLIGFIVTVILRKNYEYKPGFLVKEKFVDK